MVSPVWNHSTLRPEETMIRVIIADDHQLVRQGFQALLARTKDIQVVAEARDGKEAIDQVERLGPDVVVMDLNMPGVSGLRAAERIRASGSKTKILVLSMYSDENLVQDAIHQGAKGYLLKHNSYTELVTAIRAVDQGKTYFSPEIVTLLMTNPLRIVPTAG
jgi:DNA-binding NarL/FixJ family response regulator